MIEIRKWIQADLTIILPKPEGSYSSSSHYKYSVVLSDSLMVVTECNDDGGHSGYGSSNKYYAIKKIDDKLEICIPKFGWIPVYEEIQNAYNSETVDKIVLGD